MYESLLRELVEEARQDDEVVGLLLTGSLARGDALPGTDIDLRYVLEAGLARPFRSAPRRGVLVEQSYADARSAEEKLASNAMHVYAYLDGRILDDPKGVLARLREFARQRFETYRTPEEDKERIAFLLQCARDKIVVGLDGGDVLRAAYVTATTSWQIIEGLWAANDRPLPPNSSVRPHLQDLAQGPPEVERRFRQLFTGDTRERIDTALELIDWVQDRLRDGGRPERSV